VARRGTGATWQPYGRVRTKLVKLLEAAGFTDVQISAPQGRERSDPQFDIYRWEGFAKRGNLQCTLYSYDTMTSCIRWGIIVEPDSDKNTLWSFDVYSKGRPRVS
jgi:hypothetical protein